MSSERHVIKGRGENRGKYLCYARMAPTQKATEDGFVWLPNQRKAVRWDDPRYSGGTWQTERARVHNGYFVKLIVPKTVTERVEELQDFICSHAAGADEPQACYWFDGEFHEAGLSFCRDCAEKLVDAKYAQDPRGFDDLYPDCEDAEERYRAAIDGGFDSDHDSLQTCETCGAKLSGYLTDDGADEEIEALTGHCAPAFNQREGWDALERAIMNLSDDDPRWRKIAKLVGSAKAGEAEAERAAAELAASPGMADVRGELLGILQARAIQKAPAPSFPLWAELREWLALPWEKRDDTPEEKALEKRLIDEAKVFASCLGFRSHWSGGLFMIAAPYGDYYWPFIVKSEQYRLWNPPAFQEGRAYAISAPQGDTRYRDGNPYSSDDELHDQWDAGYMLALGEWKVTE